MTPRTSTPTSRIAIRDSLHTPTEHPAERDQDPHAPLGLTGVQGMAWIRAKRVAQLKLQAVVYAATKNITIAVRMPAALRQFIYDMRSRSSLSRDFARFVEVLAYCGAEMPRAEAWRHFQAIWDAEQELAALVFGPRVPEGPQPSPSHRLTGDTVPGCGMDRDSDSGRGVFLGAYDAHGWLESTNGRDWGRAA